MNVEVWLTYVVAAIVFSFAPGSGTINSISNGMVYGWRKSLASIVGLQLGMAVHIVLVGVGLGALVAQSTVAFSLIKWIGAVYLIWLGIQKWREQSALSIDSVDKSVTAKRLFQRAVLVNLTNPKTIVFLVALFPQFIDATQPQLPQLLILGGTTLIIDACVMLFYVSLASRFTHYIRSATVMTRLNRIFGSMFIGCGALLALARA
ncbi:homoserine/homoserine lactone efflux protein [Photobacterium carnosum]|jgi:homoserine/homoserine lactone efflux protein|uniref:Homoserine/homoserine lactone efflux protein n=1 Tax=Photobacterium carnosum TaxID=2023717 RepID=A0A2N4UUR3_9GAMM|nr:homoserine/homoserine lactone efflux protein [Photobacterium carnosum]KAE8176773.1 homoserine/homoserine lactone efflux protein [Photobacterium carnosum]MCD9494590.1 homoserine/homoserine lactone efflux protein [Photobacterium carnosum]MCD9537659.1 homoserine/homoserine lactone efflux protein [Photobacterium carnosum]MCD9541277.1 homoserine/homoserine lactone efflux protein [Photobacterium carnosum]MCD9556901.1 homoserine/homoserine lactone efflux protein [Photobacterium carnosum]